MTKLPLFPYNIKFLPFYAIILKHESPNLFLTTNSLSVLTTHIHISSYMSLKLDLSQLSAHSLPHIDTSTPTNTLTSTSKIHLLS